VGDLSFTSWSNTGDSVTAEFFRDNLYVHIRAQGVLVDEAGPLAGKLDKLILARPTLTYEQLLARRPKVELGQFNPGFKTPQGGAALRYRVSAPALTGSRPSEYKVLPVHATRDGAWTGARDGWIDLGSAGERVEVSLTAISEELLPGEASRTVESPGAPPKRPGATGPAAGPPGSSPAQPGRSPRGKT
jgi:hypothetical protein